MGRGRGRCGWRDQSDFRLPVHPSFLLALRMSADESWEGSRIRVGLHRHFVVGFCIQ